MTNINIENILGNILYRGLDKLRVKFAIEQSIPIILECLFLELYSHESKQFRKKMSSDKSYEVLIEDELLKCILDEEVNALIKGDNKIFNEVMKSFDNEEFKTILKEYKESTIFSIAMEQLYKTSRFSYKTSRNINKLIARIVKNKKFKSLYDPAIGTGTLAIEASEDHKDVHIYGQEIYQGSINICKMLLILDGRSNDMKNIYQGNTITNPMHVDNYNLNKFDCIVSDPPMALRDWGYSEAINDKYDRFKRGIPTKASGDYAFISHIVESLNEKGLGVVVVTSGVLFRSGSEGVIRQKLIEENLVECVISLPNNMMHNTAIAVNLLILNKNKNTDGILFIDVAKQVTSSRTLTILSDEIIEKIGIVYENYLEEEGFSKVVNIDDIKNNDFNLSVNRYIVEVEEDEDIDVETVNDDIKILEKKLQYIQNEIKKYMKK
ncbi:N-6 DNA methylase [Paraclostridium sordellii]|uniref:N-6 DNA methylase n=1 Tax=Paraclostridium sordellii TaxID=1505 RepID=UPI00189A94B8|nr:N-6 DNA methylase [Paeniclostridium sordellii]